MHWHKSAAFSVIAVVLMSNTCLFKNLIKGMHGMTQIMLNSQIVTCEDGLNVTFDLDKHIVGVSRADCLKTQGDLEKVSDPFLTSSNTESLLNTTKGSEGQR